MTSIPVVLTLAGSDSGGGAGIQADLLTFAANGVHGTSAITCLTAQNPDGVSSIHTVPPAFVLEQARQVARFFKPAAIKSGMLLNREITTAVAAFIREQRALAPTLPFVLDPVMVATSGARLLEDTAIAALREELLPLATLITPNLDEAAVLTGGTRTTTHGEMQKNAHTLVEKYNCAVLLKGGHLNTTILPDVLVIPGGESLTMEARRHAQTNTHGSGCTLAAAIAAHLALGHTLPNAVKAGHAYLQAGIHHPAHIGAQDFIAHTLFPTQPNPA
ncbi:MAG: bifunctional hydroxymethylpyrimidine kinase/phosphomethylpyrimidine kinase [Puniceicoccales bacterium]|jgi:hydroxymethylpyrimidine/phosphomethylpyrimidine kinase|nr:bifunctional hydroxymethylpyrimidine kinase/phosphomethylpyrimidine kinase [Puniceicoccales bacterium]